MKQPKDEASIQVRGLTVAVRRGGVKHLHLSVHPPAGAIRVSAPAGTREDVIRRLVISRLTWIRRQRARLAEVPRPPRREYTEGETLYVWGRAYRLRVRTITSGKHNVAPRGDFAELRVRAGTDRRGRERAVNRFYREELLNAIPAQARRWETATGLRASDYRVKRMRTKWGSCNPERATVWLNLELAKHPPAALSYVLLHELLHLTEPGHTPRFRALLDEHYPNWRGVRGKMQAGGIPLPFPVERG